MSADGLRGESWLREALASGPEDGPPGPPADGEGQPAGRERFRVIERLGHGSFGIVYRVWDTLLDREFAMKIPRIDSASSAEAMKRLLKEARRASTIQHKNVVRVHWLEEGEESPFLLMEYCPDRSLADWLKDRPVDPPLPARWAAELIRDVAAGVQEAHLAGVLHRDLKPGNILLVRDAQYDTDSPKFVPKVADFGLAKAIGGDDRFETATPSSAIVGTLAYIPPEHLKGTPPWLASSDVYAIGLILYELLTRTHPFPGPSMSQTMAQSLDGVSRTALRECRRSDLPHDLETICLACLRTDPDDRYASAGALRDDLDRFLNHRPILMRSYSPARRLLNAARAHPAWAALAGLSLTFVVALVVGLLVLGRSNRDLTVATDLAEHNARDAELTADAARIRLAEATLTMGEDVRAQEILRTVGQRGTRDAFPYRYIEQQSQRRVELLYQFEEPAYTSAATPDRSLIAYISNYGPIYLVRGRDVKKYTFPELASTQSLDVALSPDGRRVAILNGRKIHFFDTSTCQLTTHPGTFLPYYPPVFVDGGRMLAVQNEDWSKLAFLNASDAARPIIEWTLNDVRGFIASPDGRYLVFSSQASPAIWMVDVRNPDRRIPLADGEGKFLAGSFSPDSSRFAVVRGRARRCFVYELVDGNPHLARIVETGLGERDEAVKPVIAFSSDSRSVVVADNASSGISCSLPTGRTWEFKTKTDKIGELDKLSYSPDGRELYARVSSSSEWLRWRTSSGEPLPSFPALPGENAVGPFYESTIERGSILFATQRMLRLCHPDPKPSRAVILESEPKHPVWAVAFSPDGTQFASSDGGFAVQMRDSKTHALLRSFKGHTESVGAVAFAADGKTLASGSYESSNNLKLWDTATGRLLRDLVGHADKVRAVAFDPTGTILASGGWDRVVRLWDTGTGQQLAVLGKHDWKVTRLAYSTDGKSIAVVAQSVWLWDVATRTHRLIQSEAPDEASAIAFSPDGTTLATADYAGIIRFWDLATGRLLKLFHGEPGECRALAFSSGGETLASTSDRGPIQIWDARTGLAVLTLEGHRTFSNSLAFSPVDPILISGSNDGSIRLWDARP